VRHSGPAQLSNISLYQSLERNLFQPQKNMREGIVMEKGPANPEIKEKILAYLNTIEKAKSKDIAKAIGEAKSDVDLAVKELAIEDKVEYLYITTTFVALKGKVGAPD
jgi:hypothetical protein